MESVKQHWERLSHGPFLRLMRHCVDRIFSGSEGTEPGELDLSIATILALLATPGAFISLFCLDHYGSLILFLRGQSVRFDPYAASAGDEYFFIVLAMVVAGAVAVWKWDRLVPDRRDYSNLAPLPISSSRIFLANLAALSVLAVVLSLDVNAVSSFLFPLVVCAQETPHVFEVFFATHTLTIVAASAFGFLAVFALLGTFMALLPYRVFRKTSIYARCAIVFVLMALFTTSFSVPRKMQHLGHDPRAWVHLPPPAVVSRAVSGFTRAEERDLDLARQRGDRGVALRAPGVPRRVFLVLRAMFCAKRGNHGESARRALGAGFHGFPLARRPAFEECIPARLLSIRFSDDLSE